VEAEKTSDDEIERVLEALDQDLLQERSLTKLPI
jgi:hypothetical protein